MNPRDSVLVIMGSEGASSSTAAESRLSASAETFNVEEIKRMMITEVAPDIPPERAAMPVLIQVCTKAYVIDGHECGSIDSQCEFETIATTLGAACESVTLRHMIEDTIDVKHEPRVIPILGEPASVVRAAIRFCELLRENHCGNDLTGVTDFSKRNETVLVGWQESFIAQFREGKGKEMLFMLTHIADFLNVQQLLELTCFTIYKILAGKESTEVMREFLGCEDPHWTDEETKQMNEELAWLLQ